MSAVEAALAGLERLEQALGRERDAIARLDARALVALGEEKVTLLAEAARLLVAADTGAAREALAAGLTRLRAHAEANALLIRDAIDAVAEARGLHGGAGTYDRRARVSTPSAGLLTREI